jgi:hypothetical protein
MTPNRIGSPSVAPCRILEEKYHPSLSLSLSLSLERPFGHFQEFSSTAPQSTCSHLLISPLASNTTTGLSRSTSLSYSNPYQTKYTYCCLKTFLLIRQLNHPIKAKKTDQTYNPSLPQETKLPPFRHSYIHSCIHPPLPSFLPDHQREHISRKKNKRCRTYVRTHQWRRV